ncbi:MAG: insulinase family protein [Candidatus Eremiobacteraeota bacterium]|nr:insulinase family protein [Candidatus Eremiobacteraeota bacterium]
MNWLQTLAVLALFLCATQGAVTAAPRVQARVAVTAPHLKATTTFRVLGNGMRILVVEDHLAPVVETAMYYGFGAYDETPGKTGLAHALEHMMFRGTPSLSGDGLTDAMSQLGATINASTFPDYTRYYFVLPSEKLDLALHIEADRMQNLEISQSDWQVERGAVRTEIIGNAGSTTGRLREAMLQSIYGKNSRYALEVGGRVADVDAAGAQDLRNYYSQWYAPNNATLVITGDVAPAAVFAMANKYFAGIPRKTLPAHVRPDPHRTAGGTVAIHGDFSFGLVNVAYPFVGDVGGTETDAASLLPSIINNSRSPFFAALVESGYAFSVSAYPDTTLHNGLLYIAMTPRPPHTPADVLDLFKKTMAKFVQDGPSSDLIAAAKREVATQDTFARDSIQGLGYVNGYVVGYEQHDDAAKDADSIAKVKPSDVSAAAVKYLTEPAVVGEIVADGSRETAAASPPPQQIIDDFSAHKSTGSVVQADWVKQAIAGNLVAANHTRPVHFTLANGLNVYVQSVPINDTVYVTGAIKTSVRLDPPGKEGTGAITAALLNFGSRRYDFAARRQLQDRLSASLSIGQGFTAYGLAKDFPALIDVLSDGVQHPAFPEQYFNLVRSSFATSISRRDHSPDYQATRDLARILVPPGDPSLREPSVASVQSVTKEDVQSYYDAYFRPDLTTLTVVGNVTATQAKSALTKAFGEWHAAGLKPDLSLPPLTARPGKSERVPSTGTTVRVMLAQPAPPRSSPDFYPLMVLNTILGDGGSLTTRLMQELRIKRGLVYGVSSTYVSFADRGMLEFNLSATPENVKTAVALLKGQVASAQTTPPTDAELERAKKYIIGETLINEESLSGIASAINNIGTNSLPLDYYQTRNKIFNGVTAADVLRVAKLYLRPDSLAEVYEGPLF